MQIITGDNEAASLLTCSTRLTAYRLQQARYRHGTGERVAIHADDLHVGEGTSN